MKKILLAVMAVVAIGFTSCGNKTEQGKPVDSRLSRVSPLIPLPLLILWLRKPLVKPSAH